VRGEYQILLKCNECLEPSESEAFAAVNVFQIDVKCMTYWSCQPDFISVSPKILQKRGTGEFDQFRSEGLIQEAFLKFA
jgi:hypothetical protein